MPPGGTASYPLAFRPLAAGSYTGRLELFIPATGERCGVQDWWRADSADDQRLLTYVCLARVRRMAKIDLQRMSMQSH